jgi:hypothetical protein
MADDPTPAALPFWKSPLFLLILTAFLTRLIAVVPGVVQWFGLSSTTIGTFASGIVLAVGGVADYFALRSRATSKLQPLTTSQAKADEITAANPTPVEVKK